MAPEPSKDARSGVTITPLFILAAVTTVVALVALATAIGFDLHDNDPTPNRTTISALILAASAFSALFCVALRDSLTKLTRSYGYSRDETLGRIEGKVDEIAQSMNDHRQQTKDALQLIHEEVNRFAEGHTEELKNLTEMVRQWGEEQETRGELRGLRRAVGTASVDRQPRMHAVELRRVD